MTTVQFDSPTRAADYEKNGSPLSASQLDQSELDQLRVDHAAEQKLRKKKVHVVTILLTYR